jgi:phosphatidylglycerol:prolipoprotein diacylglycerol transferase
MHPILFKLGPLEIPTYGTILAIALVISLTLIHQDAQRRGWEGKKVQDFVLLVFLGGILGAKIFLWALDADYYFQSWDHFRSSLRSAGVLYGGIIAGTATAILLIKRFQFPLWPLLDLLAPYLALGIGIGRLSCFSAGCCYGIPHSGWFSVVFPEHPYCEAPAGIPLFPIQLLSSAFGLALFGFLYWRNRKTHQPGSTTLSFFLLYSFGRFLLEFLRGDQIRGLFFGGNLSTSQIVSLLVFTASLSILVLRRRTP